MSSVHVWIAISPTSVSVWIDKLPLDIESNLSRIVCEQEVGRCGLARNNNCVSGRARRSKNLREFELDVCTINEEEDC